MTQDEWDTAVTKAGEAEVQQHMKREYAGSGGDGGTKSGNSNTVTKNIIKNAGGTIPHPDRLENTPGLNDDKK